MSRLLLALCLLATACAKSPTPGCGCDLADQQPERVASVADPALEEISGVVASHAYDVLWVIEDSNNPAQVVALDFGGATRGTVTLTSANNQDWEDIALGPCPGDASTSCVFAADIGDNDELRPAVTAFFFPEPDASTSFDESVVPTSVDWTYPNGPANAEAFIVTPGGDAFVLTKRSDNVTVLLQAPWTGGALLEQTTASTGTGAGFSQVTGADVRREGAGLHLLVRTYGQVLEWRLSDANLASIGDVEPHSLPAPAETQGEAIGYMADGCGYWSIGEAVQAPIYRLQCP